MVWPLGRWWAGGDDELDCHTERRAESDQCGGGGLMVDLSSMSTLYGQQRATNGEVVGLRAGQVHHTGSSCSHWHDHNNLTLATGYCPGY